MEEVFPVPGVPILALCPSIPTLLFHLHMIHYLDNARNLKSGEFFDVFLRRSNSFSRRRGGDLVGGEAGLYV